MAFQTWKCVNCENEFKVGEWACLDGNNHVVAEKTYRSLDAPSDPSTRNDSLKHGRTVVCNIPPPTRVVEGNDTKMVGEGSVEFVRGRFFTSDPVQQYWLDKRPEYNCTEDQWKSVWYSDTEQLAIGKMELAASQQRLEVERNELLAQVKEQQKRQPAQAR